MARKSFQELTSPRALQRKIKGRIKYELKSFGLDLENVEKFLDILEKAPTDVWFKILSEEAQNLAEAVVDEINSQPPWWQPLNPAYKEWKKRNELNEDMLKATEDYIQSIGVQETRRTNNSIRIKVGVPTRKHRTANMYMSELAAIHEYGTRNIPARPHWQPAQRKWEFQMNHIVPRIMDQVRGALQKKLERILRSPEKAKPIKPKN